MRDARDNKLEDEREISEEEPEISEKEREMSEKEREMSEEAREMSGSGRIYHVLLALLLLLMALQPLAEIADGILIQLAFAGLLLASVATVASRRRLLKVGLALGVPATALLFAPGRIPTVAGGFLAIATLVFICFVILRRIARHPIVSSATVSASLVVYLTLGVIWARAYWLIERFRPDSFTGLSGTGNVAVQQDLYYYSYVTLATLGYGDISPVSPEARALAITEAIIGQLYLVVLVAGLVGAGISHRQRRRDQ